jgi:hypothetical protein
MWKASGTETAEEAHERSARMKFSDKCKRFRILLDGGKIPNGEKVKDLLTRIEDHSMRNVFAHSFLASDEHCCIKGMKEMTRARDVRLLDPRPSSPTHQKTAGVTQRRADHTRWRRDPSLLSEEARTDRRLVQKVACSPQRR